MTVLTACSSDSPCVARSGHCWSALDQFDVLSTTIRTLGLSKVLSALLSVTKMSTSSAMARTGTSASHRHSAYRRKRGSVWMDFMRPLLPSGTAVYDVVAGHPHRQARGDGGLGLGDAVHTL